MKHHAMLSLAGTVYNVVIVNKHMTGRNVCAFCCRATRLVYEHFVFTNVLEPCAYGARA